MWRAVLMLCTFAAATKKLIAYEGLYSFAML